MMNSVVPVTNSDFGLPTASHAGACPSFHNEIGTSSFLSLCSHNYIIIFNYIYTHTHTHIHTYFPGGTSGKEPTCRCRKNKRLEFDPWVRKIPWRRGHGNPLQYSCLENTMDRGTWQAIVHGVAESQT